MNVKALLRAALRAALHSRCSRYVGDSVYRRRRRAARARVRLCGRRQTNSQHHRHHRPRHLPLEIRRIIQPRVRSLRFPRRRRRDALSRHRELAVVAVSGERLLRRSSTTGRAAHGHLLRRDAIARASTLRGTHVSSRGVERRREASTRDARDVETAPSDPIQSCVPWQIL